jgi:hypothetical protein
LAVFPFPLVGASSSGENPPLLHMSAAILPLPISRQARPATGQIWLSFKSALLHNFSSGAKNGAIDTFWPSRDQPASQNVSEMYSIINIKQLQKISRTNGQLSEDFPPSGSTLLYTAMGAQIIWVYKGCLTHFCTLKKKHYFHQE